MKPRHVVVVLVAAGALAILVVADFVARAVVTSAIETSVRRRSGAERVDAELHTFSALWSLLTSEFSGVDVDLFEPERDGYTVDEIAFALEGVGFHAGNGSQPSSLSGHSGTAIVRVTEEQLNAGFVRSGASTRVRLVQNGIEVSTDLPRIGHTTATASVDVRGGAIVLDLSKVSVGDLHVDVPAAIPPVRITLPSVPPDTHLEAYFVVGGRLEMRVGFGEFRVVEGQFEASGVPGPAGATASMLADA